MINCFQRNPQNIFFSLLNVSFVQRMLTSKKQLMVVAQLLVMHGLCGKKASIGTQFYVGLIINLVMSNIFINFAFAMRK